MHSVKSTCIRQGTGRTTWLPDARQGKGYSDRERIRTMGQTKTVEGVRGVPGFPDVETSKAGVRLYLLAVLVAVGVFVFGRGDD